MKTEELFDRCLTLAQVKEPTGDTNRYMHETLVLCCAEALRGSGQAYGNVFSQVDYLCKRSGVSMADKIAIQTMRRHSNSTEPLSREDLLCDVRALSLLISAVFSVDIPGSPRSPAPPKDPALPENSPKSAASSAGWTTALSMPTPTTER